MSISEPVFNANLSESLTHLIGINDSFDIMTTPGWTRRGLISQFPERLLSQNANTIHVEKNNPTIGDVIAYSKEASPNANTIIAVGGGSVLDAAKAVVFLRAINGDEAKFKAYLSTPDKQIEFDSPLPRLIAVPTTSGSGSEVTRWATIWGNTGQKHSLSHPELFPSEVIYDPSLLLSLPPRETIYTGLDALSHSLESIWNKNATATSKQYANKAIDLIFTNLPKVLKDPSNLDYRNNMQIAASYAGQAISITRTAIAHSISYPLTSHFGIPHGLAASFTLPEVLKFNMDALSKNGNGVDQLASFSKEEFYERLVDFLLFLGTSDLLKPYKTSMHMEKIHNLNLINKDRSGNNIRECNNDDARSILLNSIDLFMTS